MTWTTCAKSSKIAIAGTIRNAKRRAGSRQAATGAKGEVGLSPGAGGGAPPVGGSFSSTLKAAGAYIKLVARVQVAPTGDTQAPLY